MPSGPATQHEDPFFPSKGKQPQKRRDRWQINNLAGLRCLGSRIFYKDQQSLVHPPLIVLYCFAKPHD